MVDEFHILVRHPGLAQRRARRRMRRRARRAHADAFAGQVRESSNRRILARPDRQHDVVGLRRDKNQIAAAKIGLNDRSAGKVAEFDRAAGQRLNRRSAAAMHDLDIETVFLEKPLIGSDPHRSVGRGERAVDDSNRRLARASGLRRDSPTQTSSSSHYDAESRKALRIMDRSGRFPTPAEFPSARCCCHRDRRQTRCAAWRGQ